MKEKAIAKLQRQLLLNVTYARLVEEAKGTNTALQAINTPSQAKAKNAFERWKATSKSKKINKTTNILNDVNDKINDIVIARKQKEYDFYHTEQFDNLVATLKGANYGEVYKYNLAICTLLDGSLSYLKTDLFLEQFGQKLFGNKDELKLLKADVDKVTCAIMPNVVVAPNGLSALQIVDGVTSAHLKKQKYFSAVQLGNLLCATASVITVASKQLSPLELQAFCASKLQSVNKLRLSVYDQTYLRWFDVQENAQKIAFLQNFDNYMLKNIVLPTRG